MCSSKNDNTSTPSQEDTPKTIGTKNIPPFLRAWAHIYRATPHLVVIPFSKTSITFALLSALFFYSSRLLAMVLCSSVGWPEGETFKMAVSCLIPAIHSIILLPPLWILLTKSTLVPSAKIDSFPKWWQDATNAVMEFCTGYMIYDFFNCIFYLYWTPGEGFKAEAETYSFLGHHIATSVYMSSVRLLGAGHVSAMLLMFSGECTNPFQNIRSVTEEALKEDCCQEFAKKIYPYLDFSFGVSYAFMRLVVAPIVLVYITYDLLLTKRGRANVPNGLNLTWIILAWAVPLGSLPWSFEALNIAKGYLNMTQGTTSEL